MKRNCGVYAGCVLSLFSIAASDDSLKPACHFIPQSNWMNDPNGPMYDASTGLYHLFYQYLTPRVWGHAISKDMTNWEILDTALTYTDEWYTQVPNETPGVYSGSATQMPASTDSSGGIWLSVSTPTNDMMALAYPTNMSDPKLERWSWDSANPVIYAQEGEYEEIPPGRDPTEFWQCGTAVNQYCVMYATQQSEGCPCSNTSGVVVFSSTYNPAADSPALAWGEWVNQGYLLSDTADAVMWECPDFFSLLDSTWLLKYSIGPGPDFNKPWGAAGPRDYYLTGSYNAEDVLSFIPDEEMWMDAMNRSTEVVLDVGAFYASKTFLSPELGRVLWGWLPEERPTDGHAEPWGWAGVMSLPRQVIPFEWNGQWLVRTPVVEEVMVNLRGESQFYPSFDLKSTDTVVDVLHLERSAGQQVEVVAYVTASSLTSDDMCGVRVLSSLEGEHAEEEFTEVGIGMDGDGIPFLFVDTTNSCSDPDSEVNRTSVSTAPMRGDIGEFLELRVIVDHSVVEAFLGEGRRAATRRVYPANPEDSVHIQAFSSCASGSCACRFANITVYDLKSANITSKEDSDDDDDDDDDKSDKSGDDDVPLSTEGLIAVVVVVVLVFLIFLFFVIHRSVVRRRHDSIEDLSIEDDDQPVSFNQNLL